jgi:hypothetical protein
LLADQQGEQGLGLMIEAVDALIGKRTKSNAYQALHMGMHVVTELVQRDQKGRAREVLTKLEAKHGNVQRDEARSFLNQARAAVGDGS